ncbi:transposable element Tcb1 transposase [Trichonephila clavipes]|nr:transposable element Tcb1 transposase [Trichonephila clavipes]
MVRAATSRNLRQELGEFARQQESARTVRRSLLEHGLSARRPWLRFCIQHQDCSIRGWWHHVKRTLAACISHHHTGPSPSVMVWPTIGYTCRSHFVHSDGTLNSVRYISSVLGSMTLPFIRALRNPTFQRDNTRPHVAGIVRIFLDTENVSLLPCPARSVDLLPTENVWFMVAERLARHYG